MSPREKARNLPTKHPSAFHNCCDLSVIGITRRSDCAAAASNVECDEDPTLVPEEAMSYVIRANEVAGNRARVVHTSR